MCLRSCFAKLLTALLPILATFVNSLNLKGILAHIQLTGVREAFDLHQTAPKLGRYYMFTSKSFLGSKHPIFLVVLRPKVDLHDTKPGLKKGRERLALLNNIPITETDSF